jgi:hypothetical protein
MLWHLVKYREHFTFTIIIKGCNILKLVICSYVCHANHHLANGNPRSLFVQIVSPITTNVWNTVIGVPTDLDLITTKSHVTEAPFKMGSCKYLVPNM